MIAMARIAKAGLLGAGALALSGCLSLGGDPPEKLLTLTPTIAPADGATASAGTGNAANAVSVQPIETPAKLDNNRIPVDISDTEIAYLQDAFWVEKPSRLFRRLLGETMRARGGVLVLDNDDTPLLAAKSLRGSLMEMTYDAPTSSVVVVFDAMRTNEGGTVVTRRFEARESGVLPETASVGPALNRVANQVAGEVSNWMLGG